MTMALTRTEWIPIFFKIHEGKLVAYMPGVEFKTSQQGDADFPFKGFRAPSAHELKQAAVIERACLAGWLQVHAAEERLKAN